AKISRYADTIDPMGSGKFSKETLDMKVSFYELALKGLNDIVTEPDYQANPRGLSFASTYNKAVLAKQRLEGKIADLKELQQKYEEGEISEDGKISGTGFLFWKKKYSNGDFEAKLSDIGEEEPAGKKKNGALGTGISWFWIITAVIGIAGLTAFLRRRAKKREEGETSEEGGMIEELRSGLKNIFRKKDISEEELEENKKILGLIDEIKSMIDRIMQEIQDWVTDEDYKRTIKEIRSQIKDLSVKEIDAVEINSWVEKYLGNHPAKDKVREDLLELNSLFTKLKKLLNDRNIKRKKRIEEFEAKVEELKTRFRDESEGGNYDILAIKERFPNIGKVLEYLDKQKEEGKVEETLIGTIQDLINVVVKQGMNVQEMGDVLKYIRFDEIEKAKEIIEHLEKTDAELAQVMREIVAELEAFSKDTYTPDILAGILEAKASVLSSREEADEFLEELKRKDRYVVPDPTGRPNTKLKLNFMDIGNEDGIDFCEVSVEGSPVSLRIVMKSDDKVHQKNLENLNKFLEVAESLKNNRISAVKIHELYTILRDKPQKTSQLTKFEGHTLVIEHEELEKAGLASRYLGRGEKIEAEIKSYDERLGELHLENQLVPLKLEEEQFRKSLETLLALNYCVRSEELTKQEFLWMINMHHAFGRLESLKGSKKKVISARKVKITRGGSEEEREVRREAKIEVRSVEGNSLITLKIDGLFMPLTLVLDNRAYLSILQNRAESVMPAEEQGSEEAPEQQAEEEEEEADTNNESLIMLNSRVLEIAMILAQDYKREKGVHIRAIMAMAGVLRRYPLPHNIEAFSNGLKDVEIIIPEEFLKKYGVAAEKELRIKAREYHFRENAVEFEGLEETLNLSSPKETIRTLKEVAEEITLKERESLTVEELLNYVEGLCESGKVEEKVRRLKGKKIEFDKRTEETIEEASSEESDSVKFIAVKLKKLGLQIKLFCDDRYKEWNAKVLAAVSRISREIHEGFMGPGTLLAVLEIFKRTGQDIDALSELLKGKTLRIKIRNETLEFEIAEANLQQEKIKLENKKEKRTGDCSLRSRQAFMHDLLTLGGVSFGAVTPESVINFINNQMRQGGNIEDNLKNALLGKTISIHSENASGKFAKITDIRIKDAQVLLSLDALPDNVWVKGAIQAIRTALEIAGLARKERINLKELPKRLEAFRKEQPEVKNPWNYFTDLAVNSQDKLRGYADEGWKDAFGGRPLSESEMALFTSLARELFVLKK
ncbi:hypothetical protein D6764_04370, partial [Candidatus Woesearchaeota archaeon]